MTLFLTNFTIMKSLTHMKATSQARILRMEMRMMLPKRPMKTREYMTPGFGPFTPCCSIQSKDICFNMYWFMMNNIRLRLVCNLQKFLSLALV